MHQRKIVLIAMSMIISFIIITVVAARLSNEMYNYQKYKNMNIIKVFFSILFLFLFVSCSQKDKRCLSFAESWNNRCPIELVKDEAFLAGVHYSNGEFSLSISISDNAPTSVLALHKLSEEYSRRLREIDDYTESKETGGLPFVKGVIFSSSVMCQLIDTLSLLTYTSESTQGALPIIIGISDGNDSLSYRYNEGWEQPSLYDWLNAIMPIEMCQRMPHKHSSFPPLNEVIEVTSIPCVSKDGFLKIYCSYDADPCYTSTGKPVRIDDIRGKYFSKKILEDYLADRMAESKDIYRFLNACSRRGIDIQFVVDGFKDGIDYDLSTPEFIKRWESWGGSDSMVIKLPISFQRADTLR